MLKFLPGSIFCIMQFCIQTTCFSQNINQEDIREIKFSGQQLIKEYEQLLNLISNSDVGYAKQGEIIKSSYLDGFGQQLFKSGEVVVENNLNPSWAKEDKIKDLSVADYLNKFNLFYSKSDQNSVIFQNIKTTPIRQEDYIYLEIYYESIFKGRHLNYNLPYQMTRRVATIEAQRLSGTSWDLKIVSLVFFDSKKHQQALFDKRKPINEITINWPKAAQEGDIMYEIYNDGKLITTTPDTSIVVNLPYQNSIQVFYREAEPSEIPSSKRDFNQLQHSYKAGKTYGIQWDYFGPVRLEIFQYNNLLEEVYQEVSGNSTIWEVPRKYKGQNYQFKVTSIDSPHVSILSEAFSIE
ncbi:hypothetical protein [Flexithrix dorotheae]|uniref:hypothetical protein n=1 Tax=Flexithrix dorotheae TaxID=70993 RepID=UPI0012F9557A|nr:hypothetical protein [Flexithrix dorotheae]